jgi:hypothetical protein
MRIRDIFGQPFVVTIWLGVDEMSDMGLTSWVKNSFDKLRLCETNLESHGVDVLKGKWDDDATMIRKAGDQVQAFSTIAR